MGIEGPSDVRPDGYSGGILPLSVEDLLDDTALGFSFFLCFAIFWSKTFSFDGDDAGKFLGGIECVTKRLLISVEEIS